MRTLWNSKWLTLAAFAAVVGLVLQPALADTEYEWEPGEGLHEEEWYDPGDWSFYDPGINYEYDDWGYGRDYYGYDDDTYEYDYNGYDRGYLPYYEHDYEDDNYGYYTDDEWWADDWGW